MDEQQERCDNCLFWQKTEKHEDGKGFCRRYPPCPSIFMLREGKHIIWAMTDEGDLDIEKSKTVKAWYARASDRFPTVSSSNWCGEYRSIQMPHLIQIESLRQSQAMISGWLIEKHGDNMLPLRVINILESEGLINPEKLTARSESDLLYLRNFGRWSLTQLNNWLAAQGLKLRPEDPKCNGVRS